MKTMQSDFINNLYALVMDCECKAWVLRRGQDPDIAASKVTLELMKKYRGNIVSKTAYSGTGAYSRLDPEQKAAVDLYIMNNYIKGNPQ